MFDRCVSADEPASNNCWTPYEETDRHADPSDPDRSPKGSYSTPRPQSLVEAVDSTLPKTASSKPPQHLAFKTPSDSYSNPSEGVKKPRVAGTSLNVLGAPNNKQHKAFRRPLADSDEKTWRHGRLSFSSTFSDDSPQVWICVSVMDGECLMCQPLYQQNSNVDSTKSPAASRILWREGSTFDGSADQRPDTRHISSWQGEQVRYNGYFRKNVSDSLLWLMLGMNRNCSACSAHSALFINKSARTCVMRRWR